MSEFSPTYIFTKNLARRSKQERDIELVIRRIKSNQLFLLKMTSTRFSICQRRKVISFDMKEQQIGFVVYVSRYPDGDFLYRVVNVVFVSLARKTFLLYFFL